jgi:hypothetical protein
MMLTKPEKFGLARLNRVADDSGQALVETALTMSLLLLMFIGVVELARMEFAAIELTNSARAAVQYGAQSPYYTVDQPGMTMAAQNEGNDIYALKPANFTVTFPTPTYICSDGTSTTGTTPTCSASTAVAEETLIVQTQAVFDPLIYLPGLPQTITVQGIAKQKVLIQ